MEELGGSQGFAGGSDLDCCVLDSGIVKEVMKYVGVTEEIWKQFLGLQMMTRAWQLGLMDLDNIASKSTSENAIRPMKDANSPMLMIH
ncbi:TRAPP II complex, Trs120 [Artemisia annua]|uniref:TRAPP II complex, Trs120 n=1 Tax=Artemisia annua TaxID=35608 RepID=A0A2U1PEN7_ARTAN|nr:TRAPP II complex, Trs120 [Artemisia annua]